MPSQAQRALRKARVGTALAAVNDLTRLVKLYGDTDKGIHGYLPFYERHLGPRRAMRQTVVEIGVGGYDSASPSGSLPIWRDYFFRSTIVGFDLEEKHFDFGPRVKFVRGDQSNGADLQKVVDRHGTPSVVIDDGSHIGRHIHASFDFFWPLMPPGGVYVVEDVSTSYYPDYEGGNPAPADSGIALAQILSDSVQALDPTFTIMPHFGQREAAAYPDVASVSVYPGIYFVTKAGS